MIKKTIVLFMLLISPIMVTASTTHLDANITMLGVHGTNAYFKVNETLAQSCLYSTVYVTLTSDYGRAAYSLLLAAKTKGTALYRFIYTYNTTTQICTLDLVETE